MFDNAGNLSTALLVYDKALKFHGKVFRSNLVKSEQIFNVLKHSSILKKSDGSFILLIIF